VAGLLPVSGDAATLVSASEALDWLMRLKTELLMLYWVLSVEEGSRLRMGVLERMGVVGLTARGIWETEVRDRSGKPAVSGLGLVVETAVLAADGEGMRESRRGMVAKRV
jgi:hypothetical protein